MDLVVDDCILEMLWKDTALPEDADGILIVRIDIEARYCQNTSFVLMINSTPKDTEYLTPNYTEKKTKH